jgi:hypothetical protein
MKVLFISPVFFAIRVVETKKKTSSALAILQTLERLNKFQPKRA